MYHNYWFIILKKITRSEFLFSRREFYSRLTELSDSDFEQNLVILHVDGLNKNYTFLLISTLNLY